MPAADLAVRHAAAQTALARRAAVEAAGLWAQVDRAKIGASWRLLLPRALAVLVAAQRAAAGSADGYVAGVLGDPETAGRVVPAGFAGVASDGRPLVTLLQQPVFTVLRQIGAGVGPAQALNSGRYALDMIVRTQVADAGRVAVGTALVAHPRARGYVRLVVGKTCARCLILAGRRYAWNAGFQRHPRCDCRHVPAAEDAPGDIATDPRARFNALTAAEQDRLLGRAGAAAVREGADLAKVVNARRGMATAGSTLTRVREDGSVVNVRHRVQATTTVAGRRIFTTAEAAGRWPRLMPEQIYREAGSNRAEAVRLLRLHGFLI